MVCPAVQFVLQLALVISFNAGNARWRKQEPSQTFLIAHNSESVRADAAARKNEAFPISSHASPNGSRSSCDLSFPRLDCRDDLAVGAASARRRGRRR